MRPEHPHAFSDEHVTAAATRCLRDVQRALALDAPSLAARVLTPPLLDAFRAARAGRRSPITDVPELAPAIVVSSIDETAGRAVVEIRHDGGVCPFTGRPLAGRSERWTLRRHDGRWKLAAVEAVPAASAPSTDGIARSAAFELARDDRVPDDALVPELVTDAQADLRRALREMAVIDGRYDWHVLEQVVAQVADAWRDAAELGTHDALRAVATDEATAALLASGPPRPLALRAPLGVHGGRVLLVVGADGLTQRWRLDADAARPGGWRLTRVRSVSTRSAR